MSKLEDIYGFILKNKKVRQADVSLEFGANGATYGYLNTLVHKKKIKLHMCECKQNKMYSII